MSVSENIHQQINLYLDKLETSGLARQHNSFVTSTETWPVVTHSQSRRTLVNWCSNSYLGMHLNVDVINAAADAVNEYGVGSTGTRNISGSNQLIDKLEAKLASYNNKQESVIFQSAWAANFFIKKLCDTIDGIHIFSDEENHNSMIMPMLGTRAKQAGRVYKFRHNDAADLLKQLAKVKKSEPKIIIFEDIYSMSGEYSPIEEYKKIADEYNCLLFCDVTHSFGLYDNMDKFTSIDIISGTFGKAVGVQGGFIAADSSFAKLARRTDSYIFSTSNSYANVAASLKSLEIISSETGNSLREKHRNIVSYVKSQLNEKTIYDQSSIKGHILPIKIGNEFKCKKISDDLFSKGIYLQPIFYPTVPKDKAMLRLTPTALHTVEMADDLINNLK